MYRIKRVREACRSTSNTTQSVCVCPIAAPYISVRIHTLSPYHNIAHPDSSACKPRDRCCIPSKSSCSVVRIHHRYVPSSQSSLRSTFFPPLEPLRGFITEKRDKLSTLKKTMGSKQEQVSITGHLPSTRALRTGFV